MNEEFINGGILTGSKIEEMVMTGHIQIAPFNPKQVGINSYDLCIGNEYLTIKPNKHHTYWGSPDADGNGVVPAVLVQRRHEYIELDISSPTEYIKQEIPESGLLLMPNELYLIPTLEFIHTDHFEPLITGRSSIGRNGVQVHCEAGFGDIGFAGNWTLQVKTTYPFRIYPGARMAQVYFLTPYGNIDRLYNGKYQYAEGALGSVSHKDYE